MAKRSKVNSKIKEKFKTRDNIRKGGIRNLVKYFLIVCEGVKTEPFYFELLEKDINNGIRLDVVGTGRNTLNLVEEIIKIKERKVEVSGIPFEQVWAIFDRDDFPKVNFNNAINKCYNLKEQINCAWSNEAFELWYLLHFQLCQNAINRTDYKKILEREISKRMSTEKKFKYEKNSKVMYEVLKEYGSLKMAISNAKYLEKNYIKDKNFADHNPCTKVHQLILELFPDLKNDR